MTVDFATTILLVEDSTFVRRSAVKALWSMGYQNIIEAEDGNDAIQKLQDAETVDVIVSDWVMPNKDGYELLVWVRSIDRYNEIPFIMATARGEKRQVAKAVEAGVTDFITKPFGAAELIDLIAGVLDATDKPKALGQPSAIQPRYSTSGKLLLKVAHIQITDHLALGVLKHLIETGKLQPQHFELETACMPSWNPVQQTLEKGEVEAAFILAPIAMDLFNYSVPIKMVLLAHKNGSIFVRKKVEGKGQTLQEEFRHKTFYIPHELSIHHMLSHMFLQGLGLKPGFRGRGDYDAYFEVVPPILMPEYLAANPDAGGYLVAEPLGTKAIAEGIAELMFLSGELWENHPCCVVTVRDEIIQQHPEAVQEFVNMLVQAGQFIDQKPETAASIGVPFLDPTKKLGLKHAVLQDVLKEAQGIKTNDMFPEIEALERMQQYMVNEVEIGSLIDLNQFIDIRFAEAACQNLGGQKSILRDVSEVVAGINRQQSKLHSSKASLNLEGKYLAFKVGDEAYGCEVRGVREIIDMKPITVVPHAASYIKGVINLRGDVVPVIDLAHKLGLQSKPDSKRGCIVVVEVITNTGPTLAGIAVNSVSDVIDVAAKDLFGGHSMEGLQQDYVLGYVKTSDNIRTLLDTQRLFETQPKVMS